MTAAVMSLRAIYGPACWKETPMCHGTM